MDVKASTNKVTPEMILFHYFSKNTKWEEIALTLALAHVRWSK